MDEWTDLVPALALVFTVASFWWIYLRTGRLAATAPNSFGSATPKGSTRIRFPLVIFNTGAASIVVEDLRLVVEDHALEWISVRKTLRPETGDFLDFASAFAVAGRRTHQVFAEFGETPAEWTLEPGRTYDVTIERLTGERWKKLVRFDWHSPDHDLNAYIAHRNKPRD